MTLTAGPRLGRATEDYIKAIFKLEEQGVDEPRRGVSTNRIAEVIGVSPAAASKAVRQLGRRELAVYEPYRGVSLTEAGRMVALEIIRHHRLLETFLHEILGYSWDEVDEEAERLEHHISEKFEAAIDRLLGYPSFDPHGDPIPERSGAMGPQRGTSLAEASANETLVVVRVRDRDSEVLQYLDRVGMRVGTVFDVVEKQPFCGPLTLRIDTQDRVVGRELAGHVFVERWQPEPETAPSAEG